ncbi:RNA polymerase sigma factor region1.1 domain-containing protein [Lachnoclostridium sp. Marseille-P6806]|uniref:RNA polymerase sigma factor region1.1 domain-containing protein n=1 Tax=Lachnoclostridium sp. Marseille-P6806 TaxID=2364793 RepID=UPI0013EEF67E|nr:RNA polymerase sigma factor region1.1 domain-containing protein [Lachnoclostridium sp. Marseille-P6806]
MSVDGWSDMKKENRAAEEEETLFLKALQKLLEKARDQGNVITEEELAEELGEFSLKEEQLRQVQEYLSAAGVGIGSPIPLEERLTEEENACLRDYEALVAAIEQPESGVFDAVKLAAMAGERGAQSRLAELMLPRVLDVAKLYAGQGVYLEDLIGAGNEALVRGTALLAPLEGPQEVEGRLVELMMNAMEELIEENIRMQGQDEALAERVNRVADAAKELAEALGRKVTVMELAEEGELTEEEIMEAVRASADNIPELSGGQGF